MPSLPARASAPEDSALPMCRVGPVPPAPLLEQLQKAGELAELVAQACLQNAFLSPLHFLFKAATACWVVLQRTVG